jgi:serine/threonine protein kinase
VKIDPSAWPALSTLLDEYLDLPDTSRAAWLDQLGPEYQHILPALRELLHVADLGNAISLDTLPSLTSALGSGASMDPPRDLPPGTIVGPWRLIREVGRGGMSVVWLAERADRSLQRPMALKLPILSLTQGALAERFVRERDFLAKLNHPRIARLYDAGITSWGQSYLALEYVEGETLTKYCDQHRLGIRSRLVLFLDVLGAVQFAHNNLIVHRDLKPSNILVTPEGEIRLLDFGIAKLLTGEQTQETELTQLAGRALTPDYASPEQIAGGPVTTATDVYSLGMIFYELLAGERPYRLKRTPRGGLEDAILQANPARPSQACGADAVAQARSTHPRKLARELKGDLDTVALKALQKEPARRYATADAFAQDLQRYLNQQPVLARPDGAWYRSRKFVLRHRLSLGVAAAFGTVLVAGIGLTTAMAVSANRARAEAQAVNEFLQNDLLEQASPRAQSAPATKPDLNLTVRTALDRASARISGKFNRQPLVEAAIRQTIGETYLDLGLFAEAQRQLERALDLRRRVLGEDNTSTLSTVESMGRLFGNLGRYSESERFFRRAVDGRRRLLGEENTGTLTAMNDLALQYWLQGRYAEAEPIWIKVLGIDRRVLGSEHPNTLEAMNRVALVYIRRGKNAEAVELQTQLLNIQRRTLGAEHPETLEVMTNLAIAFQHLGKYREAEFLLSDVVAAQRRMLGEQHPTTVVSMGHLASLYRMEGKFGEAETLMIQALDAGRRVLGPEHPDTLMGMVGLAHMYGLQGRYREAEPLFLKVLEARRRVLGAEHPLSVHILGELGEVILAERRYFAAGQVLRDALRMYDKTHLDHWRRYWVASMLGASLDAQGDHAQAEPLLLAGYNGMKERAGIIPADNRPSISQARAAIVRLYEAWGKPGKAEEWRRIGPLLNSRGSEPGH